MTAETRLSITVVKTVAASADRVFLAWTDPAVMKRWLAPHGLEVSEVSADPRPGGKFRIVVRVPDGSLHTVVGEYREVVPGRRIVQSWDALIEGPWGDVYPSILTVDLREVGPDSTEVTVRQDGFLSVEDGEGNREGWRQCLERLESVVGQARPRGPG